jgi:hypothetical protein
MRRRMVMPILIGLTLILSTFISTVPIVQKIAYAQARTQPSNNGVHFPNPMNPASTVLGNNGGSSKNSAVQGVAGALGSVQMTSAEHAIGKSTNLITSSGLGFSIGAILKFKQHKDNPTQEPIPLSTLVALKFIKNFRPVTPAREHLP